VSFVVSALDKLFQPIARQAGAIQRCARTVTTVELEHEPTIVADLLEGHQRRRPIDRAVEGNSVLVPLALAQFPSPKLG
jgi:hypothetical protein